MAFREFTISLEKQIFLGKSSKNNDELVRAAKRDEVLLHTKEPGSPFCNLGKSPTKQQIKEAAVICAKFSQDWRDNKKDIILHKFLKADVSKSKKMKDGTWNVKKHDEIKVKKIDIQNFEKFLKKQNETN